MNPPPRVPIATAEVVYDKLLKPILNRAEEGGVLDVFPKILDQVY